MSDAVANREAKQFWVTRDTHGTFRLYNSNFDIMGTPQEFRYAHVIEYWIFNALMAELVEVEKSREGALRSMDSAWAAASREQAQKQEALEQLAGIESFIERHFETYGYEKFEYIRVFFERIFERNLRVDGEDAYEEDDDN